LDNIFF